VFDRDFDALHGGERHGFTDTPMAILNNLPALMTALGGTTPLARMILIAAMATRQIFPRNGTDRFTPEAQ
jgi:hypothetical protein